MRKSYSLPRIGYTHSVTEKEKLVVHAPTPRGKRKPRRLDRDRTAMALGP